MLIGEGIKERQALSCNPFGGASECVTLPVTSSYADTCGSSEIEVSPLLIGFRLGFRQVADVLYCNLAGLMQVDCIYNQEEAVDVTGAPAADLLSDMKERYMVILMQDELGLVGTVSAVVSEEML